MPFSLKEDWPLLALAAVAIIGFFMLQGGGNSSPVASSEGGISPSDAAGLMQESNQIAGQLQTQQLTNQATTQADTEQGVFGLISSVIGAQEQAGENAAATTESVSANATALSADSIQAQLAEYQAYEQELGTEFGATTNMNTTLGVSANSLQSEIDQLTTQKQLTNLFGVSGLNGTNLAQLVQLEELTAA